MDCQQVKRAAVVLSLSLAACTADEAGRYAFDGPDATAFLPIDEGPFDDAVAFVANTRSGTIVPIDLKHVSLLADQYGAPWLDPRFIATGDQRQLGQIAVWAPEDDQVTLFAADLANDVLVEAPYITGIAGGEPELYPVEATEAVFDDVDGSGDDATLGGITLKPGATTTEDWLLEYDGERWWVYGSRSGKQGSQAYTGELFSSDNKEISFTPVGEATVGDTITLSTDTGIVEHDLGGTILGLARVPDTDLLLAGVWDGLAEQGSVVAWDMAAAEEAGTVDLPEGAQPWRFTFADSPDDGEPWTAFVGDAHNPAVYRLDFDLDSAGSATVETIATQGPVSALAWIGDEGLEEFGYEPYNHLFVAPAEANRVDIYDLDTETWLDVNPFDDVDGGIPLLSPVVGMSASTERVHLQEATNWGVRVDRKVIAITTFDGAIVMMEGDTGCLAIDEGGPGIATTSGIEDAPFTDRGEESNPYIYQDPATGRVIIPNSCGGIVKSEAWSVIYDGVEGSWLVEGTVSGEQESRAWEDERYTSDLGAITFLLLAGTLASTDGDSFDFEVESGVLRIDSVLNSSGTSSSALELPAAPLVVHYDAGPTGGGWDEDRTKSMVVVPVTNSDVVLRVRLDAWEVRAIWN